MGYIKRGYTVKYHAEHKAMYAYSWSSKNPVPGTQIQGAGAEGKYTGEAGFVAYYEICEYIKRGYTVKYHAEHKAMYAYSHKDENWVGYDNPTTLATKLDYVKTKGLGGAMIWAIDLDDFSGKFCEQGRYPLLTTIHNMLIKGGHKRGSESSFKHKNEVSSGKVPDVKVPDLPKLITYGIKERQFSEADIQEILLE